jgi:hypothetical protein
LEQEERQKENGPEKFSWVVTRICMNNQERKVFTFPYEIPEKFRERIDTLNTNWVPEGVLSVSPNGEFFIIREFSGKNMLIRSETGEEFALPKAKRNHYGGEEKEVALGFNAFNDLFCGTSSLNPVLVLRGIDMQTRTANEKYKKDYKFGKLSFPIYFGLAPEYWLDKDTSHDNIGMLHSILPQPEEYSNSGTIVLPFTTFQFRFLMAMVVIYDSKSGFDLAYTLVDTTRWFEKEKVFFGSSDGRYLAIHDGQQKLQIYDIKTSCIEICKISTQARKFALSYIKKAWFLPNRSIAIEMAGLSDQPTKTVIWSLQTREFSEPFFTSIVAPSETRVLSVSPREDYIAVSVVGQELFFSAGYFQRDHKFGDNHADTIEFWSTQDKKKIYTLKLKSPSNVYFAPDWSLLELEYFSGKDKKMVSEVVDLSKILPSQNDSQTQTEFREWTSVSVFRTKAKYISSTPTTVKLEKEDGKLIETPLAKLTREDREYIKYLMEEMKKNK